jgi:hypothetical protein
MNVAQERICPKIISFIVFLLTPTLVVCSGVSSTTSVDVNATIAAGIVATQQAQVNTQATIDAAVAATLAANPPAENPPPPSNSAAFAPSPLPAAGPIPDLEQVRTVILNEVNGAIAQDLSLLQSLYAPDAIVIDRNGTPADPGDDTTWLGWANIKRRYEAFFAGGHSSLTLVDLSVQMKDNQAKGVHQGVVLDGALFPDEGIYTLQKRGDKWLITQLEFGNKSGYESVTTARGPTITPSPQAGDNGIYELRIGNQHRYEEPWGWDRGDPCAAWATGNFDDTRPNYRGFNVELLLTNNSDTRVPDAWPITFKTANGKNVKACYYGYDNSGPEPGITRSVTFFTVVEKGDYVNLIIFSLNDQTIQLCLDGQGDWWKC